jgi:hypothetical protein
MIQFLISIIEWFAVVALSSIGIEADAARGCASNPNTRPAEYREAVMGTETPLVKATQVNLLSDPCQNCSRRLSFTAADQPAGTPDHATFPLQILNLHRLSVCLTRIWSYSLS